MGTNITKGSIHQLIGLLFLFIVFQDITVYAQQPVLEFNTFTALEKVTNSRSTSIIQDSVGYIWIGTDEGLYRYDGHSVYSYLFVENDPYSIPSNIINQLFIDSDHLLWICTNEGLCLYHPELDNFIPIVVQPDLRGVASAYITAIGEDKTGQIYVACDEIIYKYNKSQQTFSKVVELVQGRVNALIFDEQNNIWIAATLNGGLNYFNQETQELTSFLSDSSQKQSISSMEIHDVALVKDILWIATDGGGINAYNLTNQTFNRYSFPLNLENYAINILVDSDGEIWICTYGGLKLYNQASDNFYSWFHEPNNPASVSGSLWDIFEDNQGNYWTSNTEGGVKIVKNKNNFKNIDSRPNQLWYTSNKNTTSVAVDADGNLWAGFYLSGIDVFKWKERQTVRYLNKKDDPRSVGNGSTFSIFRDSEDQMWIGTYLGGLQKYNPETDDFESYTHDPDDTLSIAINDVRSITEDQNGDLWLAVQGKGVDRFDRKTKTFHHFNVKNNRLSNDYAFQVLNDSRGNLWVATSWGLSLLEKGESIFRNFFFIKGDLTTINSNVVLSVFEDQQQVIWVGTAEGLNRFDYESQTFTRYSAGLKNKNVGAILSDRDNNIWVSTNMGISKFDQKTKQFINFDQSDGLLSRDFTDRSCFIDSDNNLYFGGSEGIDYFNPDSLYLERKKPVVVLTDFKIFNKSISWKTDSAIIDKHISYAGKIVLGYKSNSFTFHYQAINPSNPDALSYTYLLDGFDKDWIDAQTKSEASFTNMEPGKYTFRVKAKYDNEEWSEQETTVDLIIVPAWWMTIWFKILMIVFGLTVVFGVFRLRTKQLHHQRRKLELLVIERTNEIQNKNDQLKALNSTKDKLFSIISHDLRSPFNTILGFQDLLLNDYDDLSDSDRVGMIKQVYATTNQVYYLVENLLNWASIQTGNIKSQPANLNLREVIHEKLDLYRNIAEAKEIKLLFKIPDGLFAWADINLLESSLRNLINNAIKFTQRGGTILVEARRQNNSVNISVTDNGTGMTREQIDNLYNLEKTKINKGTNGEKGSGLGLLLCKEFVEKNRGTITVESQPGKGSVFSFTLSTIPWEEI